MLNLFLTCSELIFKIFVGSLSTGSYRVAKGQHHHLLESLAKFTSSSRNHLQMPQNDSDWQPATAPGVCWSFSLSLPPAERMRTRSGWEIRGHPHILGAGGRITTHDRRILMILLTKWASFASFWAVLNSCCNVSFSAWKQLSAHKSPVVNLSHCLNVWSNSSNKTLLEVGAFRASAVPARLSSFSCAFSGKP